MEIMQFIKSILVLSVLAGSQVAFAMMENSPVSKPSKASVKAEMETNQIIIKFKSNKEKSCGINAQTAQAAMAQLSQSAGVTLEYVRPMSGQSHVVKLSEKKSDDELSVIIQKLKKNPDILYAEPDRIAKIMLAPNDTRYNEQWHYHASAVEPGGANLPGAWDITTGGSGQVVAVIDTGILPHTDLAGKTVAGYDFITDIDTANDGDGRDANATDPGDWDTSGDSSWHGTHVAGTIAAATNNSNGVAGINWNGKVLPVRVLGTGGGYTSDIVDGVRWAAGIPVPGVPDNTHPAKVLNLSLGGGYPCNTTWQSAIDDINAEGAIMVVSAGNSNADASNFSPASCENVITVAATSREGGRSYYSNFGNTVEVAAPGGDYYLDTMILSTLDGGTTTANNDNTFAAYQGTSMSAPHVSGIVSLMANVKTDLNISSAIEILAATSRAFPTGTSNDCTTALCGSGIIDAQAAVYAAQNGIPGSGITPTMDFSGNGYNDLVWHNYLNGAVKLWSMHGTNKVEEIPIVSSANSNLVVKAFADFNNDGKPDILFHNQNSGQVRIWLMNGTTKVSNNAVLESSNTNLKVIGAGDFTGDGNIDIAVHNIVTGALRIWVMDGNLHRTDNIEAIASSNINLYGAGVGDLNADGKPDVLLHNSATGNVRAWMMNGTVKVSNELIANSSNTNLKVRGVVDIDADGKDDILWQNRNTGVVLLWKMDGIVKVGSNIELGSNSDLTWDVDAGTGGEPTITTVTEGSSTPGSIDVAYQINWYRYTAATTGTLNVRSTGTTDTVSYFYDYDLNGLAYNDDNPYPNFSYNVDVTAGETYFIKVRGYSTTIGAYTLVVGTPTP